jgi:hypothetical protein
MVPVVANMWPEAALGMEAVLLTSLAGETLWQGCLNASGGGGMGSAGRTLAGASCGGKIGGKLSIKPDKGCNDVHFDSIRDNKNFANAEEARAGGWRVVGRKSKTTNIQSWFLIKM